jgi:motility quorum-sensing regulator / GCU-specific mRNA interferase toxin
MEKGAPHCKLSIVKLMVREGRVRASFSATRDAKLLGFEPQEMYQVVLSLSMRDFFKSMTTHEDHRVWQDVYRPMTSKGAVYLKLTVIEDVLIVSFKEL